MIPLEDDFNDILGKAMRGLDLGPAEIASRSGLGLRQVRALLAGSFDEAAVRVVAPLLGLDANGLAAIGRREWVPDAHEPIEGLACFSTPYRDFHVNAYLVWDPQTGMAAAFDTGSDATSLLEAIEIRGLRLAHIFLTHTHGDHVMDLARLRGGAVTHVSASEPLPEAVPIAEGDTVDVGHLHVRALATSGHSRGGTTYVVSGLTVPLAAVGDAMFAGSIGGGLVSYADALHNNRTKILALPGETVLLPGHGPLTTVAEQRAHNPFFPDH